MESSIFITIILGIAGVILVVLIIKHLFKLALCLCILLAVYAGYLYQSGQKIPLTKNEIIEHGEKKFGLIKQESEKIIKEIKK